MIIPENAFIEENRTGFLKSKAIKKRIKIDGKKKNRKDFMLTAEEIYLLEAYSKSYKVSQSAVIGFLIKENSKVSNRPKQKNVLTMVFEQLNETMKKL